MQNKNKIVFVASFLVALVVSVFWGLSSVGVSAQEESSSTQEDAKYLRNAKRVEAVVVADINIRNATIEEAAQGNFKIDFDVTNFMDAQSNLVYVLELVKKTSDGKVVFSDNKIFAEDKITIKKDETIRKEIVYQSPEFLIGEYELWLKIKDESGLVLALKSFNIKLAGSGKYVEFGNPCYLTIEGEKQKKYSLSQGVDLKKEEELFLECQVTNHADEKLTVIPSFDFYSRDDFGKSVLNSVDDNQKLSFDTSESRLVKIPIVLPENPQSYDVKIQFKKDDQIFSNPVIAHFVVAGVSASIVNASLNNTDYKKGETAIISVLLAGPADGFAGARGIRSNLTDAFLEVEIADSKGKSCADKYSYDWTGNGLKSEVKLSVPVINDCTYPQVFLKIIRNGEILSEKNMNFEKAADKNMLISTSGNIDNMLECNNFLIVSIIIMAIVLLLLLIWKLRNTVKVAIFAISFSLLAGFMPNASMAATVDLPGLSFLAPIGALIMLGAGSVPLSACGITQPSTPLCSGHADTGPCIEHGFDMKILRDTDRLGNLSYKACYQDYIQYTYSLDDNTLAQGETGRINTTIAAINTCNNGVVAGVQVDSVDPSTGPYEDIIDPIRINDTDQSPTSGSYSFNTAGYSPGNHMANLYLYFWHGTSASGTPYNTDANLNYTVASTPPSCSATFDPNALIVGNTGEMILAMNGDADNIAECSCVGNIGVSRNISLPPGRYNQGPFTNTGSRTCTCTVKNSSNITRTCLGTLTSVASTPVVTLTATPATLNLNNGTQIISAKNTTLNWSITNSSQACSGGCTCEASGGWSGSKNSPSGSQEITIGNGGSNAYILTCTGSGGSGSAQVEVNALCTSLQWYDVSCNKTCGDGAVRKCHNINADCSQPDDCADQPCNLSPCPVSSEMIEVRP